MNLETMLRDLICRWLHRQGLPYNRDGKTYQRCLGWPLPRKERMQGELSLGCGRELLCGVQFLGRSPFRPHTEREMEGVEKRFIETQGQEQDVATILERERGKR